MRWGLGRGEKARDTVAHALAMLPAGEPSRERAVLLVTQVRFLMLQGRYLQTFRAADEALEAIAATDAEDLRATVLNKLGVALLVGGEPERGIASLREAIELAHATESLAEWCAAYTNLSDGLHALGRSEEAMAVAHEGLALLDPGLSGARWLSVAAGEIAFDMGDWAEARDRIAPRMSAAGAGRANALLGPSGLCTHRAVALDLGLGNAGLSGPGHVVERTLLGFRATESCPYVVPGPRLEPLGHADLLVSRVRTRLVVVRDRALEAAGLGAEEAAEVRAP